MNVWRIAEEKKAFFLEALFANNSCHIIRELELSP